MSIDKSMFVTASDVAGDGVMVVSMVSEAELTTLGCTPLEIKALSKLDPESVEFETKVNAIVARINAKVAGGSTPSNNGKLKQAAKANAPVAVSHQMRIDGVRSNAWNTIVSGKDLAGKPVEVRFALSYAASFLVDLVVGKWINYTRAEQSTETTYVSPAADATVTDAAATWADSNGVKVCNVFHRGAGIRFAYVGVLPATDAVALNEALATILTKSTISQFDRAEKTLDAVAVIKLSDAEVQAKIEVLKARKKMAGVNDEMGLKIQAAIDALILGF